MLTGKGRRGERFVSRIIGSRLCEAELVCLEIRRLLEANDLMQRCFPVELLARECLVNAILHGNKKNADKLIWIRCDLGREWIRLEIRDQGTGFAWRRAASQPLKPSAASGRGLQLCALLASRVRFNRRGNQITLWISK